MRLRRVLGIVVLATLVVMVAWVCAMWLREYEVLETFDVGDGRTLTVLRETSWEGTIGHYYQASVQGRLQISKTLFDGYSPEHTPRFSVVTAGDGSMAGLVETSRPLSLLVIHDFSTGESFPFRRGDETWQQSFANGRTLLRRFRALRHDDRYTLKQFGPEQ